MDENLEAVFARVKACEIFCEGFTTEQLEATSLRELVEAVEPFATFAKDNVDDDGWTTNCCRERILDWFGPSDFRALAPFGEPDNAG